MLLGASNAKPGETGDSESDSEMMDPRSFGKLGGISDSEPDSEMIDAPSLDEAAARGDFMTFPLDFLVRGGGREERETCLLVDDSAIDSGTLETPVGLMSFSETTECGAEDYQCERGLSGFYH